VATARQHLHHRRHRRTHQHHRRRRPDAGRGHPDLGRGEGRRRRGRGDHLRHGERSGDARRNPRDGDRDRVRQTGRGGGGRVPGCARCAAVPRARRAAHAPPAPGVPEGRGAARPASSATAPVRAQRARDPHLHPAADGLMPASWRASHYAVAGALVVRGEGDADWVETIETIPWAITRLRVTGAIESSLYDALDKAMADSFLPAGERRQLAWAIADVYDWEVDFSRDVRPGDRFTVLL